MRPFTELRRGTQGCHQKPVHRPHISPSPEGEQAERPSNPIRSEQPGAPERV